MNCNGRNKKGATLLHVAGNPLDLAMPLTVLVRRVVGSAETDVEEDFVPNPSYDVDVVLSKPNRNYRYKATMTGNVATVHIGADVPSGTYDLTLTCRDSQYQAQPLRYHEKAAVKVVSATADANLPSGVEFEELPVLLERSVYFYAKGDPGFTPEEAQAMREAFAADQEQRAETFAASQEAQATAFNEAQSARADAFSASEASRANTFSTNEASRTSTFSANEAERTSTFNTNEAGRTSTFNTNEATRQAGETARMSAESGRVSAESGRVSAEAVRVVAENGRVQAESGRVSAENERAAADVERGQQISALADRVTAVEGGVSTNAGDIDAIEGKIPSAASSSNQLADKAFVADAISTARADFKGTYNTLADLQAVTGANANDYGYVIVVDALGNKSYDRYKFVEGTGTGTGWVYEYTVSSTTFTSAEWAAIQSGLSSADKSVIDALADASDVAALPAPSGAADIATMQEMLDDAVSAVVGAERVNCELLGSVVRITDRTGLKRSVDLLSATDEVVQIVVTTNVQGVSVSGLVINAYYNDASVPTASVTTDANGMGSLRVPNGYKYKLVFPDIAGCLPIADVVHTASVSQRSVEVEYKDQGSVANEHVIVLVQEMRGDTVTLLSGVEISVTVDGQTGTYESSNGKAQFDIPIGKTYTVTAPSRTGEYIQGGTSTYTFTAEGSVRTMGYTYRLYDSGLFIVATDGVEYALDEWVEALAQGTRTNTEAYLIKVATTALETANGVFLVDIDHLAERTYGANKSWASQNVLFNTIPSNGNSVSADYYYDGLTASKLIQTEGDNRGIGTDAVDKCLILSREINGNPHQGFLGSVGQWNQLWANRVEVDNILDVVRPGHTYTFASLTTNKWTCTQSSANGAYIWSSAGGSYTKTGTNAVVPFFAY